MNINKAKQVREALSLTPTEAGQLLFGYTAKQAYDTWAQWESGAKKPSKPTLAYFDLILFLAMARDFKTPGAGQALDRYLAALKDGHGGN